MKKRNREIPLKNYIYLALVFAGIIFLLIYFNNWYKVYKQDKLGIPIMSDLLAEIKYEEINSYVTESKDLILYVSKADDEKTRDFEKKFARQIKKHYLKDDFLFLNVSIMTDEVKQNVKQFYGVNFTENTPNITVFNDGIISDVYTIKDYNVNDTIKYIEKEIKSLEEGI